VQFLPQKSGNVVRFDAVDGGACQVLIDGSQIRLPMKDDVRGVFTLIDTPVILHPQLSKDRAEALGELVQLPVNPLRLPTVGNLLRQSPVADLHKSVVPQLVGDVCFRSCAASQLCPLK